MVTKCQAVIQTQGNLRRFGLWRALETPCLLTSQVPWAIAGAYVAPLQSVLISIIMLTGLLSKVFFGFSPSNHRGEYNDIIILAIEIISTKQNNLISFEAITNEIFLCSECSAFGTARERTTSQEASFRKSLENPFMIELPSL